MPKSLAGPPPLLWSMQLWAWFDHSFWTVQVWPEPSVKLPCWALQMSPISPVLGSGSYQASGGP